MSLYYEGSALVSTGNQQTGSLKSRVFNSKATWKSPTAQLYALVSEASKWSPVLSEVIERSSLLAHERSLSPSLALLLVHDLLLSKKGIAAPAAHSLRISVERHKTRLQAEFTRARLRRGCPSVEVLRAEVERSTSSHVKNDQTSERWPHPRWVRINNLKTSLNEQLGTTFAEYRRADTLREILASDSKLTMKEVLYVDQHIPNLIALPPRTDLSNNLAYCQGSIILQDKASCFPAYLLDPKASDGRILDACAAPGNKTTHIAALLQPHIGEPSIWACEKNEERAAVLRRMVEIAGANEIVSVMAGQDFLKLNPNLEPSDRIGALLLDPSCSGSGILGRDESLTFSLPRKEASIAVAKSSKKRKRQASTTTSTSSNDVVEEAAIVETSGPGLAARLESLSAFQTRLLLHAFAFPVARKVTYSTCSVYEEENEDVVTAALKSTVARERGWRILRRKEQVPGMSAWNIRGRIKSHESSSEERKAIAEACIRCDPLTLDGTQGFFVAAFIRDVDAEDPEESWGGFEDADDQPEY